MAIDDVEDAVRALLLANSGITDLVVDRIHPTILPEGAVYPAITIELVTATRITAPLLAVADPGAVDARIQITAWGPIKKDVKRISKVAREAIQRWRGTIDGFVIWDIITTSEGPSLYDNDLLLHGAPFDYTISYPE